MPEQRLQAHAESFLPARLPPCATPAHQRSISSYVPQAQVASSCTKFMHKLYAKSVPAGMPGALP